MIPLRHLLSINFNCDARSTRLRGQPLERVFVEEWPWRNDDQEGESSASEADPETQRDVMRYVSGYESDNL